MITIKTFISAIFLFLISFQLFAQQNREVLDIMLSNYKYPFEVKFINLKNQKEHLKMAYMDVAATKPNGKTVVLLHGKNFNGAYWKTTIEALTKEGFRVIVPDQIGFGKSSKPTSYQYTFQQLSLNTKILLDTLQIEKIHLLGHSMGGMLATRFALMYPEKVEKLVLENPIGLEDWKTVAPYVSIDQNYLSELNASYETTRKYQLEFYYDNKWKPEYDEWVYLLTGWIKHPEYATVAFVNAKTSDMIFTQPVVYEFTNLSMPTLLIIGTRDRTALNKALVKDVEVRNKMGQYQLLGKQTQSMIKKAQLIELDNVGHLPHIETFDRFIKPLTLFLKN